MSTFALVLWVLALAAFLVAALLLHRARTLGPAFVAWGLALVALVHVLQGAGVA